MAKTGETRKTKQPLKIDRLPPSVWESIAILRNTYGKTWEQIEALSSEKFNKDLVPLGCFVDWDSLDTEVLALFPKRRLPKSNLQRWHDIRVDQVKHEVLRRSAQARELAVAFAKADVAGSDSAVQNATRDTIMSMLAEDATQDGRNNTVKHLLKLAEIQQKGKAVKLLERRVAVDEQTLQIKLDDIKSKAATLIATVEGGEPGAPVQLTREQLLEQVRGIYGIA
jgi:hypothetical protein